MTDSSTLSLDEIKKIELDLLIELKNICTQLGLRYYLIGGTLLGAIRHQGFIPWDDDVDVGMPRSDYNRLIEWSKQYQHRHYQWLFCENGQNLLPFGKLVDTRTKLWAQYSDDEIHRHVWIDIIPLDGLPENMDEVQKIYRQAFFYRRIFNICGARLGEGQNLWKKIARIIAKPILLSLKWRSRSALYLNRLAMQYDYDASEYVGAISWGLYGQAERMKKSAIGDACEVLFEQEKFNTFCCWDEYLKSLYGDYMTLPPINQRKSHHIMAWLTNH